MMTLYPFGRLRGKNKLWSHTELSLAHMQSQIADKYTDALGWEIIFLAVYHSKPFGAEEASLS